MDVVDLCVAKLCALREKDRNFVAALLDADLVDPYDIVRRLPTVDPDQAPKVDAALRWLTSRVTEEPT